MVHLPAYIWGFEPPKEGSGGHRNACLCSLPASDERPDLLLAAAFVIARLVNECQLCPVYPIQAV
ncbi:hypothetical protein NC653_038083 [Populus alba x Populus x berolinensis]|uniref:Uncharacterized protein n=1 Tax=Populus alba x Populus x berolinensis TaxID=444605 RepID=A0AAD6LFZ8_9ROSI|nr:hypothetical protein NC653_038083 [Populus alba x Populus x berolinensis]